MSTSEFSYIPESPEQSFGNNKGIFTPTDIYDLTRADKYTNYGQLELIETQTYSSTVSEINFNNIKQDTYHVHFMTFNNMKTAGDNQETMCLRLMVNGVVQTSSDYQRTIQRISSSGGLFTESKSTGDSQVRIIYGTGTATGESSSGYVYFYNLGDNTKYSFISTQATSMTSDPHYAGAFGNAVYDIANEVDGIQVRKNSGDYSDFTVSLYGIKEYS